MGHFARECRGPRNQDSRNMNQDSSRRTINVEESSSKAMVAIDGAGLFSPPKLDLSNSGLEEFQQPEFEGYGPKTSKSVSEDITNEVKEFPDAPLVKELVSDDKLTAITIKGKGWLRFINFLKTQLDDLRIEFNKSEFNLTTYKRGLTSVEKQLVFYKKNEVFFCEQLAVLKRDISYKDSEISMLKSELEKLKQEKESNQLKIENFDNASKSLYKLIGSQITDKSRKGVGFVSYNAVPPPHIGLFSPLNLDLSYSGLEEFQQPNFDGYGPKSSKSVSEDISKEVRESLDAPLVEELESDDKNPGHLQKEDQGYADSGCSRHMTGNMSYLSDFNEFDGGYVTFGGGAKGGKITGKGTLKTGKLDFEDMYFVKKLRFNLFSVSQMCDKKNSILFTDTGCFVLSHDFKLSDES
ncbi:hypothetical protein Tco_0204859 [Tanacetum coccineum]